MTGRTRVRVVLLSLPFLLAACGTTRDGVMLDATRVSARELIELVRERSGRVRTLSGSGTLIFNSPRMSGAAQFSLALSKPDSLLLRLEGPLGIDVGLLFLHGSGYVAYNSLENEVMAGGTDSSALLALVPVPLSPRQIVDAFSGRTTIDPGAAVIAYGVDGDRFLLTSLEAADTCRYWIDPDALAVTRYRRTGPDGRVVLEGEVSRLTTVNDIEIPRSIILRAPTRRSTLRITFADMDANGDPADFTYTIPADARRSTRPLP
jgi:hypothetical protein